MTAKEQKAVDAALESIKYVSERDPAAPELSVEDEVVCRGRFAAAFVRL